MRISEQDVEILKDRAADWGGDLPRLDAGQQQAIVELLGPRLPVEGREAFLGHLDRIYARAVRRHAVVETEAQKPARAVRTELKNLSKALAAASSAIAGLDHASVRVLDRAIADLIRQSRIVPNGEDWSVSPRVTFQTWRKTVLDHLTYLGPIVEDLEIVLTSGSRHGVWRQMIIGLVALVTDVTGEKPKRTSRATDPATSERQVEDYWFLDLVKFLARAVDPDAPALTGVVREVLKDARTVDKQGG